MNIHQSRYDYYTHSNYYSFYTSTKNGKAFISQAYSVWKFNKLCFG